MNKIVNILLLFIIRIFFVGLKNGELVVDIKEVSMYRIHELILGHNVSFTVSITNFQECFPEFKK